ncbi:hypothetical protein Btru_057020 [Bulinus truncatus]|nr:hypothetical protein Btru_057020 [Bulinus truncatus]
MDETDTETKNNFSKLEQHLTHELKGELVERDLSTSDSKIELGARIKDAESYRHETEVDQDEPSETSVTRDEPSETLVTRDEPLETLMTRDEPSETLVTRDEQTETLVTRDEPSETLVTRDEPIQSNVSKVQTRMNKTDAETKNNFSNIQSKLSRAVQRIRQKEIKIKSLMSEVKRIEKKFDLQWTYLVGKNTTVHNPPKPGLMLDQLEKKAARNYIAYPYRLDWHIQGSDKPRKKGIEKKEFNQSSKNSKASST